MSTVDEEMKQRIQESFERAGALRHMMTIAVSFAVQADAEAFLQQLEKVRRLHDIGHAELRLNVYAASHMAMPISQAEVWCRKEDREVIEMCGEAFKKGLLNG